MQTNRYYAGSRATYRVAELLPLFDQLFHALHPLAADGLGGLTAVAALADLPVGLVVLRHLRHRLRHLVQAGQAALDVRVKLLKRPGWRVQIQGHCREARVS